MPIDKTYKQRIKRMKIYKVTVSKDNKQYLTVAPLLESKAAVRAKKLHEEFPYGTVTVSETTNPDEGWKEVWIISPDKREVDTYNELEEE